PSLHEVSLVQPLGAPVRFIDRVRRRLARYVTVDRSSFRVSTLTTVTSGVSVRVANTLPIIIVNNKTAAEAPIIIFVLRLNAIFICPLSNNVCLSELVKSAIFLRISYQRTNTTRMVQSFNNVWTGSAN